MNPPPALERIMTRSLFLRLRRLALALAAAALAAGATACGTTRLYEGAQRAPEEVAVVEHDHSTSNYRFYVTHVDGKSVAGNAEVLPGHHVVNIGFASGNWYTADTQLVDLEAQAGRRYRPAGRVTSFDTRSAKSLSNLYLEEVPQGPK